MIDRAKQLALITGAASGIGKATVRRLLEDGTAVLALDQSREGLAVLSKEVRDPQRLVTVEFDLRNTAQLASFVDGLMREHGAITQLVNNAGIWPGSPLLEFKDETWADTMAVNLTAPFILTREIGKSMMRSGGGAIVNIASRNAFRSSTNNAAYDASKAALAALTRTSAGELARYHIRVNAVCPGVIDTPANNQLEDSFVAAYRKIIPMDRFGRADEIASVIRFLLSDEASFMTGETLVVDGGQIACQDNERFMEVSRLRR